MKNINNIADPRAAFRASSPVINKAPRINSILGKAKARKLIEDFEKRPKFSTARENICGLVTL